MSLKKQKAHILHTHTKIPIAWSSHVEFDSITSSDTHSEDHSKSEDTFNNALHTLNQSKTRNKETTPHPQKRLKTKKSRKVKKD